MLIWAIKSYSSHSCVVPKCAGKGYKKQGDLLPEIRAERYMVGLRGRGLQQRLDFGPQIRDRITGQIKDHDGEFF